MNIGAEIPFRRSRRGTRATGSLIFDLQRDERLREAAESPDEPVPVWNNGRFRRN